MYLNKAVTELLYKNILKEGKSEIYLDLDFFPFDNVPKEQLE
jgi:hypothetical protein